MSHDINRTWKTWWQVIAPQELARGSMAVDAPRYVWVATGSYGCQCGVERTQADAEQKAQCAAVVLSDLQNGKYE